MEAKQFDTQSTIQTSSGSYEIFSLARLEEAGETHLDRLPFSIRVLLENALRNFETGGASEVDVRNLASWPVQQEHRPIIPFYPGRVVMQDFTGLPVLVDLAATRSAIAKMGGDPNKINPVVPVDVVIDHSVQVDYYGTPEALQLNAEIEFKRNHERYEMLHWGQKAFQNFSVVPPATGIVHQVNLEFLSKVVLTREENGRKIAIPDTLVGTDSHTTMVNGLGVAGWGVGGIEAIAGMLGQPLEMLVPDVVGFELRGALPEGVTPTDLTLTIVQMLRNKGVVGKFVEFYGPGIASLSLADRAMISNMTPETGATMLYFPVDERTLEYLRFTGRPESQVELVETYTKAQRLFHLNTTPAPEFTSRLELDLSCVEPSIAGPKRPQDRITLTEIQSVFHSALVAPRSERGYAVPADQTGRTVQIHDNGSSVELRHGSVVIAAITSCTNTSDPFVMVGAGLLAKKAVEAGLTVEPYVKTSMAPGSRVVTEYLKRADLLEPLAQLGFDLVGYGCTTCIGNSGPLDPEVVDAINEGHLVVAAVLSGNRNFEGRISPQTQANFLASPPLVVAYALAGTMDIDLIHEPLGADKNGAPVYLRDIWPSSAEVNEVIHNSLKPEMFARSYAGVYTGNPTWNEIPGRGGVLFDWDRDSTYIQEPPYFENITVNMPTPGDIHEARVLALLGNSVTTDHISPAGTIPSNSPAGKYLIERGVQPKDFNSFGSRRGNDRIMTRGTFGNIRLKNLLVPGSEGNVTLHMPDGEQMSIFEAAMEYKEEGVPLIILAGKEYGTGSSRDWAAKGTFLLGVKAVIAESFERIHRSNLAGMGVLPLQFKPCENAASLGLTGHEIFSIEGIAEGVVPGKELRVTATQEDGSQVQFDVIARLDTDHDVTYYRNGGILQTVLLELLSER